MFSGKNDKFAFPPLLLLRFFLPRRSFRYQKKSVKSEEMERVISLFSRTDYKEMFAVEKTSLQVDCDQIEKLKFRVYLVR